MLRNYIQTIFYTSLRYSKNIIKNFDLNYFIIIHKKFHYYLQLFWDIRDVYRPIPNINSHAFGLRLSFNLDTYTLCKLERIEKPWKCFLFMMQIKASDSTFINVACWILFSQNLIIMTRITNTHIIAFTSFENPINLVATCTTFIRSVDFFYKKKKKKKWVR